MQTIYEYAGENLAELHRSYSDVVRQEFYDGELDTSVDGHMSLSVRKALACPISLISITANNKISYRRTTTHIRSNQVELYVLWLVRRGSLKVVRSSGTCIAQENFGAILSSQTPFYAEISPDENGVHDSVQAVIPAHLFRTHMPNLVGFEKAFSTDNGSGRIANELTRLLFGQSAGLSPQVLEPLVAGLLRTTAESVRTVWDEKKQRRSIVDQRRADVEAYVMRHLTNPELSSSAVAAGCGISPRYLCYLLKTNNTSFSELVWSKRLEKAREWLAAPAMRHHLIHEIAYMAGFKSAAHFSRVFKAAFGVTPKAFREEQIRNEMLSGGAQPGASEAVSQAA